MKKRICPECARPLAPTLKRTALYCCKKCCVKAGNRRTGIARRERSLRERFNRRDFCDKCGTLPHRVQGRRCSICGLAYAPDTPPTALFALIGSTAGYTVDAGLEVA